MLSGPEFFFVSEFSNSIQNLVFTYSATKHNLLSLMGEFKYDLNSLHFIILFKQNDGRDKLFPED